MRRQNDNDIAGNGGKYYETSNMMYIITFSVRCIWIVLCCRKMITDEGNKWMKSERWWKCFENLVYNAQAHIVCGCQWKSRIEQSSMRPHIFGTSNSPLHYEWHDRKCMKDLTSHTSLCECNVEFIDVCKNNNDIMGYVTSSQVLQYFGIHASLRVWRRGNAYARRETF